MGDIQKSYALYEDYLKIDPLWGWGWIGYFRQLHDNKDERFETVLDKLYEDIKTKKQFRYKEDLCREVGDEYHDLGNIERAENLYKLEKEERTAKRNLSRYVFSKPKSIQSKKIYPNDSCPCGSGLKYKKCCGRNR